MYERFTMLCFFFYSNLRFLREFLGFCNRNVATAIMAVVDFGWTKMSPLTRTREVMGLFFEKTKRGVFQELVGMI